MQNPTEALFTAALGLVAPWECTIVDFRKDDSQIDITLDFPRGARFRCPECHAEQLPIHDTMDKTWRHLDFFQHTCYLHARVPRVTCPTHGVRQVTLPWARAGSGFTLLFEALALMLMRDMPVSRAATQLRVHDKRLWRILSHYIGHARERVEYPHVTAIAVDETSRRRGHQYVTVVADTVGKRVLFAAPGKDKATIGRFVQDFHEHNGDPDAVRDICMDMSPAFIEAAREYLPNAELTFDRFHVMKLASDAMDAVRREAVQRDSSLKGTRYLWLSRPDSLTRADEQKLDAALRTNDRMARGYHLVLDLRTFYTLDTLCDAEAYLRRWYGRARRSRLEPFRKFAKTIKMHWDGIVNYHRSRMTAGYMEGLNSVIQAAKRKARGYPNDDNFVMMIYLLAGKLSLQTTHSI